MMMSDQETTQRLEYLRSQIEAQCISYGELIELQSLADSIEPGDVQLLEWAGVPKREPWPSKFLSDLVLPANSAHNTNAKWRKSV